jgi:hypothetical protein
VGRVVGGGGWSWRGGAWRVLGGRKSLGTNRVADSVSFMSVVIEPMTY